MSSRMRKKCYDRHRPGAAGGTAPKTNAAPGAGGGFNFTNAAISTNFGAPTGPAPVPWVPFGQAQGQGQAGAQPFWNPGQGPSPQQQGLQPSNAPIPAVATATAPGAPMSAFNTLINSLLTTPATTTPPASSAATTTAATGVTASGANPPGTTAVPTSTPTTTTTTWSYPLSTPLTSTGVAAPTDKGQPASFPPYTNHLFAVPVPPEKPKKSESESDQQTLPLTNKQQPPEQESICVAPFRKLNLQPFQLQYSADFLAQRLDQVRLQAAQDTIKARDEAEAKAEAEKRSQARVRSYEVPSTEEYRQILTGHALQLHNYMKANIWNAKLRADTNAKNMNTLKSHVGLGVTINRDTGASASASARPGTGIGNYQVQANQDMYARQRAQRHSKLISSMDARILYNAENIEPRLNGARLPRKTSWAHLDKSVVNDLLEKKAKLEAEGPEPGYTKEIFTNFNPGGSGGQSGVILRSPLYYCKPSLSELDALTVPSSSKGDCTSTCLVQNFEIGHELYGNIVFRGTINVAGINLDRTVRFRQGKVQLYYTDEPLPPHGQGLNHPFVATLYRMRPATKSTPIGREKSGGDRPKSDNEGRSATITPEAVTVTADMVRTYEALLRQTCARVGAEFLDYNYTKGSWTFRVNELGGRGGPET